MDSNERNRKDLFDRWSVRYDLDVNEGNFPLFGYKEVLHKIIRLADLDSDHRILDVGVGTGNLSKLVPLPAKQIWGADYSDRMLQKASEVLAQSNLIQVDLRNRHWPAKMKRSFDRILSAYTFHEFTDFNKIALIQRLTRESLAQGGLIVIGDISFPSLKSYKKVHQHYQTLWDEEEYYWCAEKMIPSLEEAGFNVRYDQFSVCGGIYRLTRKLRDSSSMFEKDD